MTLLGAPIGGILSDILKSPSKVLLGVQALGILGFIMLLTVHIDDSADFDCIDIDFICSSIYWPGRVLCDHYGSGHS